MATKTTTKKSTAKKSEWTKPAKPASAPTTLVERDYQYKDAKGEYRYFQGYDAAYKRALMIDSRNPASSTNDASVKVLVAKGWSTADREKDQRAKAVAKAERTKRKATAKKAA